MVAFGFILVEAYCFNVITACRPTISSCDSARLSRLRQARCEQMRLADGHGTEELQEVVAWIQWVVLSWGLYAVLISTTRGETTLEHVWFKGHRTDSKKKNL